MSKKEEVLEEELKRVKLENQELKRKNDILNQYLKSAEEHNIVSKGDLKGNITYVNDIFIDASLYSKDEILGRPHRILKGEDNKELFRSLWKTIKSKKSWKGIIKNRKKDGTFYYVSNIITPVLDENGEIFEYISFRHEVTDLVLKREKLENLLREDHLTKIANRYKFIEDISNTNYPSLALLDIIDFASINDLFSNKKGDKLLFTIAQRLKEEVEKYPNYKIYRVHSDEFAILADLEIKEEFLQNVKDIVRAVVKEPISLNFKDNYIEFRTVFSFEDKSYILESADLVKKHFKTNKDEFIYSKELGLEQVYENNRKWALKIKNALDDDRIIPFYQAIYNNKTQKIEKYECLVRLIDEDGKIHSPYFFLDIAKKSRQYLAITKRVIEKAFEKFKDNNYEFSINLTLEDLSNEKMRTFILDKLKKYNIASRVVFEIVESEEIEDFTLINEFLSQIQALGVKIAIDDFGSGYSNFAYIISLKADYIKIDGSLIKDFTQNEDHCNIVTTIMEFAKLQNMKTIAEFVSKKEILDKVNAVGIDYAQGYYVHEPSSDLLDE